MRSILITTAVLVVLITAFTVFLLTQKTTLPSIRHAKKNATSLPALQDPSGNSANVGGGERGWVQTFDKKTGEMLNEFHADHFDPPVNNQVHVIRAEGRFYSKDGSILVLHAAWGDITMADSAHQNYKMGSMQSQPPSHGILHDVTLGLLESPSDTVPVMVATLPIVAFDNDTLRLNTINLPAADGNPEIAADRIPVKVRGRDYDFDGQGLIIRYNQRDGRLERLEVAHGQRLLIKNPKAFGGMPGAPSSSAAPISFDGIPIQLASADNDVAAKMSEQEREQHRAKREAATRRAARDAKRTARSTPGTSRPSSRPASTQPKIPKELFAYHATFEDNVHLKEGDAPIGTADRMIATFTFNQNGNASTQPGAQPASAPARPGVTPASTVPPATRPVRRARATQPAGTVATVQPSSRPARRARSAATMTATTTASTSATTQPQGPIEVTWTGKLTVVPQKLVESGLRSMSDRIVEFFGKPVHLQREGQTIDAAYVWAAKEGGRFRAAPDANTPLVTMHQPDGTTLITESIDADGDDVVMHGQSQADMLVAGDTPPKTMRTTWTKSANIRLVTSADGKRGISRAVLNGNVNVNHPQLKMTSDMLDLGFLPDPTKDQAQLSTVHADGAVHAAVTNADGTIQTIVSSTLDLATVPGPNGTMAVRSLHAHGDVVASDPKQTLKTDDLNTTLAPNTVSANADTPTTFNVEQLTAAGNVQFSTTDGTTASSDKLSVDRVGGAQWVTLTGTPAHVTNPQSTINGNQIRVDFTGAHATVDGAGTMTGAQKSADGTPSQPIEVAWSQSLVYDGAANAAKVVGDIDITSHGADGTTDHAKGKTLDILFADAPTTRPATAPATQSGGFASMGGGGQNKQVKRLTLHGPGPDNENVEVSSILYYANAPTLWQRHTYLFAPMVIVDVNPDGSAGAMTVPSAGKLLYEDINPAATQPATTQAATSAPAATSQPSSSHGSVAMKWAKQMVYDPTKQQAMLEGEVHVVHRVPGSDPVEIDAPRLIADVTGAGGGPSGAQFKKMTADQGATLYGKNMRIDAAKAVYEPAIDRIIATGTPRQPVKWYDEKGGLTHGGLAEVWWNVKTNQPEKMLDVTVEMNK